MLLSIEKYFFLASKSMVQQSSCTPIQIDDNTQLNQGSPSSHIDFEVLVTLLCPQIFLGQPQLLL